MVLFYELSIILFLIFLFCFFRSFPGEFWWYPHVWASILLAIIYWGVFSSLGPPWSLTGGWLLQNCCRVTFFIVATSTGCHDDKITFVWTLSEKILPETNNWFPVFWKQSPDILFCLNKNRNLISLESTVHMLFFHLL